MSDASVTGHLVEDHAAFERGMKATGDGWIRDLRQQGLQSFMAQGFPSTRDEAWIHTDLATMARQRYALPETASVEIGIFNLLGQRIRSLVKQEQPAGYYSVERPDNASDWNLQAQMTFLFPK